MRLELTPQQEAYRQTIRAFAETYVAPRAAAIDESNAEAWVVACTTSSHVSVAKALLESDKTVL